MVCNGMEMNRDGNGNWAAAPHPAAEPYRQKVPSKMLLTSF